MEHVFATSDSRGRVCLRDSRMTFGPRSSRSSKPIHQVLSFFSHFLYEHRVLNSRCYYWQVCHDPIKANSEPLFKPGNK
jgi:hypothetical protein